MNQNACSSLFSRIQVMPLLLLFSMLISPLANARYDVKTYIALSGGVAALDHDVGTYEQADSTSEAYELTVGWDITNRFSLEMSWSDLGDFEYRSNDNPALSHDDLDLFSYRMNGVFYLFSSDGYKGVRDRTGFSGFVKIGAGLIENRAIFSDLDDELDGAFATLGLGLEVGLNRSTFFRFQIQSFDDNLALGSAAIMWRWGRNVRN